MKFNGIKIGREFYSGTERVCVTKTKTNIEREWDQTEKKKRNKANINDQNSHYVHENNTYHTYITRT